MRVRSLRPFLILPIAAAYMGLPVVVTPAMAITQIVRSTSLSPDDATALPPGKWVWRPELAPEGEVRIQVDLSAQIAYVYRGGTLIGLSTVSTGRDGYPTPSGVFPILQKQVEHRSTLYNSAPMPYMQRLTWDGVALHAGSVPGYRSSHGCVHLPDAFAKLLFEATQVGAVVEINDFADQILTASSATASADGGTETAAP